MGIHKAGKNCMYDLIGDIHGYANRLSVLLEKMNYRNKGGHYAHPARLAIFLGDLIDRGPKIRETVHLVRDMVEAGTALAVMGNHEFNALCFHTKDPQSGDYLRSHTESHLTQHQATQEAFRGHSVEWQETLDWFKTLPLFLELGGIRIVHACWDDRLLEVPGWVPNRRPVETSFLVEASRKESELFRTIDTLIKGPEIPLPDGAIIDKDGALRSKIRVRWWLEASSRTYREVALGYDGEMLQQIPDKPIPREFHCLFPIYRSTQKPVFIGHYWMKGSRPERAATNIACLDYSVAKGGPMVAYRWDGEAEIDNGKFVTA